MFQLRISENVCVRSLLDDDVYDYYDLLNRNRHDISRYVQLDAVCDLPSLRVNFLEYKRRFVNRTGLFLGVFFERDICGEIRFDIKAINETRDTSHGNIAYWLDIKMRGRGLIYQCLRVLLPVISRMAWMSERTVKSFDATVERSNYSSQSILQRLGFRRPEPSASPVEIVLDKIAPINTQQWILMCDGTDLVAQLGAAEMTYLDLRNTLETSADNAVEEKRNKISLLVRSFEGLSNTTSVEADVQSFSRLLQMESLLSCLITAVSPGRVLSPEIKAGIRPVTEADFEGKWVESDSSDSLIIIMGHYCIKGYRQEFDGHTLGGLSITEFTDSSLTLSDGDDLQTWTRLSHGTEWNHDGIYKTSRGFFGIFGSDCVSSSSVWEIQFDNELYRWVLSLGEQWKYNLESFAFESISWKTEIDSTIMKRSARKKGNTGPMKWIRHGSVFHDQETGKVVRSMLTSLRNASVAKCIQLRETEIQLVMKTANLHRKLLKQAAAYANGNTSYDELTYAHRETLNELTVVKQQIRTWNEFEVSTRSVLYNDLDNFISAAIAVEIED